MEMWMHRQHTGLYLSEACVCACVFVCSSGNCWVKRVFVWVKISLSPIFPPAFPPNHSSVANQISPTLLHLYAFRSQIGIRNRNLENFKELSNENMWSSVGLFR